MKGDYISNQEVKELAQDKVKFIKTHLSNLIHDILSHENMLEDFLSILEEYKLLPEEEELFEINKLLEQIEFRLKELIECLNERLNGN